MPYIPPEVIAEAKRIDLLTYLKNCEPQELVHFCGGTYCTREHDSLKISNGKWYWFSRGIGGYTALDYLTKVKGRPFLEAVEAIVGRSAVLELPPPAAPKEKKPKELLLPRANSCLTHAVNYLERRGIDKELIEYCIRTGRLYESYPHHNVVFVGVDQQGIPRYANLRGICSSFKGEANGSDKRFSFSIPAQDSKTVHLFESAIDLLSYATVRKMEGLAWNEDHLLSLAGVYRPKKDIRESSLPLALTQYFTGHPEIRKICLRLDNDFTGRLAAETLVHLLGDNYAVTVFLPPYGKDYNDYLCQRLGLAVSNCREDKER